MTHLKADQNSEISRERNTKKSNYKAEDETAGRRKGSGFVLCGASVLTLPLLLTVNLLMILLKKNKVNSSDEGVNAWPVRVGVQQR